ncbi:MAG: hypothetical protein EOM23_11935, partial [Candidatus Moranbacteria bacterium]|nr:hypothetical protein [Candidatus Moranbacteria bacterium]
MMTNEIKKNIKSNEGGKMFKRHYGLILFAGMLLCMLFSPSANAQAELNDMDSLWVNIENYSTAEANDKLSLTFTWETYHRPYNQKSRSFTAEWGKFEKANQLAYRVIVSTDSLFSVITKSQDAQGKEATFTDLEFGTKYYAKVEPVGITNDYKALPSEGIIFKNSNITAKSDRNIFQMFWDFSKQGGILMPFIYAFALFGLLVVIPITWWKLRLANVFPPNKSGFLYTLLPFDIRGKTDFMTDKGNAYIMEIVKYWGKAMEAQNLKPSLWKDEDEYIKSSMQEQEEMKKKLWVKVGLPNIEKAIEVCKNG